MRMMIRFSIPVGPGNHAIADGRLGPLLGRLLEQLAPEAAHFFIQHGRRTGLLVCDLVSSDRIPEIAEPLFVGLDAEVDFWPVMTATELQAGLARAAKGA